MVEPVGAVGGVEEGAATAGVVVLLDDGDLYAGVCETGGEGDATDAGAWSQSAGTETAGTGGEKDEPTMRAVFGFLSDMFAVCGLWPGGN